MSESWGHAIRLIRKDFLTCSGHTPERCVGGHFCVQPAIYEASYQYITGRAGRVSTARRWLCQEHAAKWAQKYHQEEAFIALSLELRRLTAESAAVKADPLSATPRENG